MKTSHTKEGFTLIEVMLALTIGFLVVAGGLYMFNTIRHRANVQKTESGIQTLKTSIDMYNAQKDKYPEKLSQLVPRYVQKVPKDGWGNVYYYKVTGRKPPYQLYSYGPNGPEEGTPDERISAWD